jgi:hypothetical protein
VRRALFLRLSTQLSLKAPDPSRCLQAHRQSPSPCLRRKHTRSQGPSLRRHYPASTVILPCPTPADAVARSDVEAAALTPNGSPPITRTTFPTCRAHYPGGSSGCSCQLLPRSRGLPPKGVHNAGSLTYEVMITYPFHPLVRQSVLVVGDKEHANGRSRLQMDGLPESEVRMSEKHTRFLGRHSAMRVGMRIDAARTSRFERLQS